MRWEMKITERGGPAVTGDDLEHAGREVRRQRSGHLVEQQHVRLDREGAGQVDDPQRGERQVAGLDAQVELGNAEVGDALAEGLEGVSVSTRFSATVRSGMIAGSWYTDTMPVRRASAGEWTARSWPRSRIVPPSGLTAPVRILTSVLLPAPFAPISAWISPGRTLSDASRSAVTAP